MKPHGALKIYDKTAMPPTRGHDLKRTQLSKIDRLKPMPPTRGHDLKQTTFPILSCRCGDAPHTGARLETKPC